MSHAFDGLRLGLPGSDYLKKCGKKHPEFVKKALFARSVVKKPEQYGKLAAFAKNSKSILFDCDKESDT